MMSVFKTAMEGMQWSQPSAFSRSYELKIGDLMIGTLEFKKALGSLAEARMAEGQWSFKRRGFLSPSVGARNLGSDTDIAVYEPNWSGMKGTLTVGGRTLGFKSSNFWATEWMFVSPEGQPMVRFHGRGVFHHGAAVEVDEAGRKAEELPLLLALGWYLIVMHTQDSAVVAGA